MTQILKPCPWCRNEGVEITHPDGCHSHWAVCLDDDCQAEGPCCNTEAEAIAAWNTRRSDPDELREALTRISRLSGASFMCDRDWANQAKNIARTALSRNVGDVG